MTAEEKRARAAARMRAYVAKNKDRIYAQQRARLTPEKKAQYNLNRVLKRFPKEIHAEIRRKVAAGVCEACGGTSSRNLEVDHNHKTGEFRGVLCISCNVSLGHLKDDLERIANLFSYLIWRG